MSANLLYMLAGMCSVWTGNAITAKHYRLAACIFCVGIAVVLFAGSRA